MNVNKFITLTLLLIFVYAAKSNAATYWLQARSGSTIGQSYSFPYPQPMVEYENTAEGFYAASLQIAEATCGTLVAEFSPLSLSCYEVRGGVSSYAYCHWNMNCGSTGKSATFNWDSHACEDGTYPDPSSTGITCETTEPQYCPDGEVYNNVAGTCEAPPPPPTPPPEKNLGSCPPGPSPYVASDTK